MSDATDPLAVAAAERRARERLRVEQTSPPQRLRIVAAAAALFAAAFAARLAVDDPGALLANFYTIPIALLAVQFGLRAGLAAAAVAFALVLAWKVFEDVDVSVLGYTSRLAVFVVVGGVIGGYAERLRHDIAQRRRAQRELELYADELERSNERLALSVRRLDAFARIARAVGGETDVDRVLELILAQGREILPGRELVVQLRDEDDPPPPAVAAIRAPLRYRGEVLGTLVVIGDGAHADEDRALAEAIAASAAAALATARSAAGERLRQSIEGAERARARWARELHDETLQGLGAIGMLLQTALQSGDPDVLRRATGGAYEHLVGEVEGLRDLIAELRPAALDDLGLGPALETLAERNALAGGFAVAVDLPPAGDERLPAECERTIYRLVQEALTNVTKHAAASSVRVRVARMDGRVEIDVTDDGHGFDPAAARPGFGLIGMRERAELAGGTVTFESALGGPTHVRAEVPLPG